MDRVEVMRRALAAHVGRGIADDGSVVLVGGIHASPQVVEVNRHGSVAVVELQLGLHGGPFGDRWSFERWGSIGTSVEEAIVHGVQEWLHVPYRALERALDGSEPAVRAEVHGAAVRAFVDDVMMRGADEVKSVVARLAGGSPCGQVLARPELLPVLAPGRAHLLTCFAARPGEGEPMIEVSIDGSPWPPAGRALAYLRWPDHVTYVSFRQTALLFADGAPTLERSCLARTWAALASRDPRREMFGASEHGYALAPPLGEPALQVLRDHGIDLPADYARYVTEISGWGAGPYHGLLPPHVPSQLRTAVGTFPHTSRWQRDGIDDDDDSLVAGTVALSHMGCGYFSFLVVNGPARGEVWADLRYAGGGLVPTHASFTAWYVDGLDACIRGQLPTLAVADGRCALPRALSDFARELERNQEGVDVRKALAELSQGAIRTAAEGTSRRFDAGDPLALCPHCVALVDNLGIPPQAIVPGAPPKPWREIG